MVENHDGVFRWYAKRNYGTDVRYPATKIDREIFEVLRPNQKTVRNQDIDALKYFGFEIEQVLAPFEV